MFEWITNAINSVIDAITGGSDQPSSPPDPCDVGDCLAAREALETARRDVERACLLLKMAMVPLRTAVWIISRPIRDYVIALIIAAILGGPMGIVIAVAIYLGALLFVYAWLPVVNAAGQTLVQAFEAEASAIGDVIQECSEDCRDDTDPSECDVLGDGTGLPATPWDRLLGLDRFNIQA